MIFVILALLYFVSAVYLCYNARYAEEIIYGKDTENNTMEFLASFLAWTPVVNTVFAFVMIGKQFRKSFETFKEKD